MESGGKESKWTDCWRHQSSQADERNCYQSTLIVAIALERKDVSDLFVKLLKKRWPSEKLDFMRWPVGFVCVDHMSTGYFRDDDVSVLKAVCHSLLPYLYTWLSLTTLSHVYRKSVVKAGFPRYRRALKIQAAVTTRDHLQEDVISLVRLDAASLNLSKSQKLQETDALKKNLDISPATPIVGTSIRGSVSGTADFGVYT